MKPVQIMQFQLDGAISYNSMIEIEGWLPSNTQKQEIAVIACTLKCNKVQLIMMNIPTTNVKEKANENY